MELAADFMPETWRIEGGRWAGRVGAAVAGGAPRRFVLSVQYIYIYMYVYINNVNTIIISSD